PGEARGQRRVLTPRRLRCRGRVPAAFGDAEPRDRPRREIDLRKDADLLVRGQAVERERQRRGRRQVKVALLHGEGERSIRLLVRIDDQVATEHALAGPPARIRAVQLAVALERPDDGGPEQPSERQDVRAAAGSPDGVGEPAVETGVERRPRESLDALDRIPARFAARRRRPLEGHGRLLGRDGLHPQGGRVDNGPEPHVMDDSARLKVAADGHEAALAEIEDGAGDVELAVAALDERDAKGAAVEWMAVHVETHAATLSRVGRTMQACWHWRSGAGMDGSHA